MAGIALPVPVTGLTKWRVPILMKLETVLFFWQTLWSIEEARESGDEKRTIVTVQRKRNREGKPVSNRPSGTHNGKENPDKPASGYSKWEGKP